MGSKYAFAQKKVLQKILTLKTFTKHPGEYMR